MIIREEVELVEEISNIDATQWIHLRKGQDTRKSATVRLDDEKGGEYQRLT